jgi:hypothetical protein
MGLTIRGRLDLTALYAPRSNAGEFLAGFQQTGPRLAYNVGRSFGDSVAWAGVPRMRLHNVRHVDASLGLATGTSVKVVAARLGHSDPSITLRTYAHVLPHEETAAAERLGALLSIETDYCMIQDNVILQAAECPVCDRRTCERPKPTARTRRLSRLVHRTAIAAIHRRTVRSVVMRTQPLSRALQHS